MSGPDCVMDAMDYDGFLGKSTLGRFSPAITLNFVQELALTLSCGSGKWLMEWIAIGSIRFLLGSGFYGIAMIASCQLILLSTCEHHHHHQQLRQRQTTRQPTSTAPRSTGRYLQRCW